MMAMGLAHDLATKDDATTRQILDNVILLLVPSLNPDGWDLVAAVVHEDARHAVRGERAAADLSDLHRPR